MFGEIGSLLNVFKNLPKIKEEAERMRARLPQLVAEGESGAGMVKAKVNGLMEVIRIEISDEAAADKELLESLVASACTQAIKKAQQLAAEEARKLASVLGLPEGMQLPPGLPGLS